MQDRYVLSSPPWLQYGLLGIALASGLAAFAWTAREAYAGPVGALHTLLGGFALVVLVTAANVRLWRRWIHAVADRDGLWLPTRAGRLLRIDWRDVGRVEAVPHRLAGLAGGAVRVYVNIGDEAWRQVSWRHPNDHPPADADVPAGFRPLRIGALGHRAGPTARAIEGVRPG